MHFQQLVMHSVQLHILIYILELQIRYQSLSYTQCEYYQCCGLYRITSVQIWISCFCTTLDLKYGEQIVYPKILQNRNSIFILQLQLILKLKKGLNRYLKGQKNILPPRFMTIKQFCEQLIQASQNYQEKAYNENTKCIGLARVSYSTQKIVTGPLKRFLTENMGPPLHSFDFCAQTLHSMQQQMYEHFTN